MAESVSLALHWGISWEDWVTPIQEADIAVCTAVHFGGKKQFGIVEMMQSNQSTVSDETLNATSDCNPPNHQCHHSLLFLCAYYAVLN